MGDAEVIPIEDVAPELKTAGSGGGAEMVFQNVCVDANGKRILWDVSGKALPGQMLALMGPSGKSRHNVQAHLPTTPTFCIQLDSRMRKAVRINFS